ncbi:hypothetical protein GCK32_008313 [Trichostrongylus colubriformis]|uniref:Choline O-acetyltransferase n=1 Tax=Trichostrongylus colubriformis TaxID=6319 RepID=A0AAN8F197_TRICO
MVIQPGRRVAVDVAGERIKGTPMWRLFMDPMIAVCFGALIMAKVLLAFLEPTITNWMAESMPDTPVWLSKMEQNEGVQQLCCGWYEAPLPKPPIPTLDHTLDRYIEYAEVVAEGRHQPLQRTQRAVQDFRKAGLVYQERLLRLAETEENWAFVVHTRVDGNLLPFADIFFQLRQVLRMPEARKGLAVAVGAAGVGNRDRAARFWSAMQEVETNSISLTWARDALFVVCLDDDETKGASAQNSDADSQSHERNLIQQGKHILTGGGSSGHGLNRWFDATVQLIVSSNGTNGICSEHSPTEGIVLIHVAESALQYVRENRKRTTVGLFTKIWKEINHKDSAVALALLRLTNELDLEVLIFNDFGRSFMKKSGFSPDGFVQLALQLAHYKTWSDTVLTITFLHYSSWRDNLWKVEKSKICRISFGIPYGKRCCGFHCLPASSTAIFALGHSHSVTFFARSLQRCRDRFKEESERSAALGIALAFISFGCIIAPPFISVLYSLAGNPVPFLILSFVFLADALAVFMVIQPGRRVAVDVVGERIKGTPMWRLFMDPMIAVCSGALIMANVSLAFLESTITNWMEEAFVVHTRVDGNLLPFVDIFFQLRKVLRMSEARKGLAVAVGAAGVGNRDRAARFWSAMQEVETNSISLTWARDALFVVCLDDDETKGASAQSDADSQSHETNLIQQGKHILTGGGSSGHGLNRWFDATIQLIVSSNGTNGICTEHSPNEGIALIRVAESALRYERENRKQTTVGLFTKIWKGFNHIESAVALSTATVRFCVRLTYELDLEVLIFNDFGRDFMKESGFSPDGFVQLALQLAHFKQNQSFFFQETRLVLMRRAAEKQALITQENLVGHGIDNHLYALLVLARQSVESGEIESLPDIFRDPLWKEMLRFPLSTSQVTTSPDIANRYLCYGPLVRDGYGCAYNLQNDTIIFSPSAFKSNPRTNLAAFKDSIRSALYDMRNLLVN